MISCLWLLEREPSCSYYTISRRSEHRVSCYCKGRSSNFVAEQWQCLDVVLPGPRFRIPEALQKALIHLRGKFWVTTLFDAEDLGRSMKDMSRIFIGSPGTRVDSRKTPHKVCVYVSRRTQVGVIVSEVQKLIRLPPVI